VKITDRKVEAGDTVTLGNVEDSHTAVARGGSLRLIAAHTGEPTEYVALRFQAADGAEIDAGGEVLAVEPGSGMSNPAVWMLIPTGEYES